MDSLTLGISFSIIATVFLGANFIAVGRGLKPNLRLEGIFITLIFSTITIFFASILSGEFMYLSSIDSNSFILYIVAGFFNFVLGRTFNYSGITLIGPSRTSAIISSQVLFSVFFAFFFLPETLSLLLFLGAFLAFIGIAIVSLSQESNNKFALRGVTYAIIAAASIGIAFVMIRSANLVANKPVDGALIAYSTATLCYLPFVIKKMLKTKVNYPIKEMSILIFAGLLSGTAQTSRFIALSVSPVALVSCIIAINPLVTICLSLFTKENMEILNNKLYLGSLIAVIGVIIVVLALN